MKNQIDHIIYTAQDLEQGMDAIEQLLGVRPVFSGKHPLFGTHTALLSLGNNMYFEVIAPDPDLEPPPQGLWLERFFNRPPGLSTWVMSTDELATIHKQAVAGGIDLGEIQSGKRQKTDGSFIHWRMTNPYALPMDGLLPFVIDWRDTPHPSLSLPKAGILKQFILKHPNSAFLRSACAVLQINNVEVHQHHSPGIEVVIETTDGHTKVLKTM